jgi:hypothetical protein
MVKRTSLEGNVARSLDRWMRSAIGGRTDYPRCDDGATLRRIQESGPGENILTVRLRSMVDQAF